MNNTAPDGPAEIWRERPDRRSGEPVVTALDLAAVLADWPFGPGRFWFVTGRRLEMYDVA